ncbi:AbrB family transcriptional regulator [Longimycelium tulufanense]|uniref:AbrB family transcriptional regulator n=1 Tax=Longimycelium tulufanense TaxID=907463 RepID=UPI001663F20A|nr:AbrB family transcriptional regulator [Longimycelium tulufanense]
MSRWGLFAMICYLVGIGAKQLGVPAPYLVAAIVVGAVAALTNIVRRQFPRRSAHASHAAVGVLMGSYLDPDSLRSVAKSATPLLLATAATLVASVLIAVGLARTRRLSLPDAVLGTVPGGSAAIVASAGEVGADSRLVAFAQYLRVGLVALTAPAIAAMVQSSPGREVTTTSNLLHDLTHPVGSTNQVAGLLMLVGVSVLGVQCARRLKLPAATVLGPMVLAAIVQVTGTSDGFAPSGALRDLVFVGVGLEVGLRFTRAAVLHAAQVLPHLLVGILLLCLVSAGLAELLAVVTKMRFLDAYLATTPGGINAVLATAEETGSDVAVISTVQSVRLFAMALVAPSIIQRLLPRFDVAERIPIPVTRQPEKDTAPA